MGRKPAIHFDGASSSILAKQTKQVPIELHLPAAHPKQAELINAFDARRLPNGQVIFNPGTGGFNYTAYQALPLAYPDLKFVVGACGTKFGKTYGCSILVTRMAWEEKDSLNWWVAPSYRQSEMAYRLVKRLLPKDTFVEYKADLRLELIEPDGGFHSAIEFKSAENDDNLRGFGVHFAILDEAARISQPAYESVWTTMTQTDGRMVIISTPKGRNWFYDEYQKGEKSGL